MLAKLPTTLQDAVRRLRKDNPGHSLVLPLDDPRVSDFELLAIGVEGHTVATLMARREDARWLSEMTARFGHGGI
jgi:hypothetical protein